jgi:hypothetical protein
MDIALVGDNLIKVFHNVRILGVIIVNLTLINGSPLKASEKRLRERVLVNAASCGSRNI